MRVAAITDIHGNSHALDAVLEAIEGDKPDAIVCLGDLVSGPLDPAGTLDRLMALDCPVVMGNHDRWVSVPGEAPMHPIDQFAADRLSDGQLDWLRSLPATYVLDGDILLCHGTPASDEETWLDEFFDDGRTTRLPDEETVARRAGGTDHSLMMCGHTHIARATRLRDGRLIVNPGAVGLQFVQGLPDARYGLFDRRGDGWSVTLRAVDYDREGAARLAAENGYPHWREALVYGWAGIENLF